MKMIKGPATQIFEFTSGHLGLSDNRMLPKSLDDYHLLLVGGLEHFLFFHILIGNVIIPSD